MMRTIYKLFLLLLFLTTTPGCGKPASSKAAAAESDRPPVAVETVKVATSNLELTVEVVGTLAARSEAEVKTEYSGTVTEVYVTQWVQVKKGTPLARLDTREANAMVQAARAAALQSEVATQRAARELNRTLKLKEAGLATQQGLDEAQTAHEAARAASAAAQAQLESARTRQAKAVFRAPIDGVVAARNVNVGDYVENMGNPAPMFRIVDNRVLELTVSIPSARMSDLKVGQPLAFSTEAVPGKQFTGKVSFINPAADEVSRTVKVKAEVPNNGGMLKTGLFVKGRIITGTRSGVLVIARSALVSWDTAARAASVFVVERGAAKRRTIETGAAAGEAVEIIQGLAAGDEVVTRGGFNLRDGDRLRVVQGG